MDTLKAAYNDARADPTLLSTLDIEKVLKETEDVHYIEGKTTKDISKEIFEAVDASDIDENKKREICGRLSGYRWVDRICDLRNGRLVRWIKNGKLTNGGLLMNVKIENTCTLLLCKNNVGRFFTVHWDNSIVFQKCSLEEQLIIMANDMYTSEDLNPCTS